MTVFYQNFICKTNCEPNLARRTVIYKPPPRRWEMRVSVPGEPVDSCVEMMGVRSVSINRYHT